MGFTVNIATDQARGNAINKNTKQGALLNVLTDLSLQGGGDFTLFRSGNAPEWDFDFSEGQQGSDKYSDVIFSTRNMVNPKLRRKAIGARTVGLVAGQGEGEARLTAVAFGDDYATTNDIEMYYDARDLETSGELTDRGEERLEAQKAQRVLTFGLVQVADTFYSPVPIANRHTYNVGDIVRARYYGDRRREITAVTIDWQPDQPARIDVETEDG